LWFWHPYSSKPIVSVYVVSVNGLAHKRLIATASYRYICAACQFEQHEGVVG